MPDEFYIALGVLGIGVGIIRFACSTFNDAPSKPAIAVGALVALGGFGLLCRGVATLVFAN